MWSLLLCILNTCLYSVTHTCTGTVFNAVCQIAAGVASPGITILWIYLIACVLCLSQIFFRYISSIIFYGGRKFGRSIYVYMYLASGKPSYCATIVETNIQLSFVLIMCMYSVHVVLKCMLFFFYLLACTCNLHLYKYTVQFPTLQLCYLALT